MKTKIALNIIITTMLLCASQAYARLGETAAKIYARYGAVQKRTETGTNTWFGGYLFKDYYVVVHYRNNVSEAEAVRPIGNRQFSGPERQQLMDSIGGSTNWVDDNAVFHFTSDQWVNTDNHAVAYEDEPLMEAPTLMVMSRDYYNRRVAEIKKQEKSKASGF